MNYRLFILLQVLLCTVQLHDARCNCAVCTDKCYRGCQKWRIKRGRMTKSVWTVSRWPNYKPEGKCTEKHCCTHRAKVHKNVTKASRSSSSPCWFASASYHLLHSTRTEAKNKTQSTHQIVREDESCHADKRNVTIGWLTGGFCFQVWAIHWDWSSATAYILALNDTANARWQLLYTEYLSSIQRLKNTCEGVTLDAYFYYHFLSPMPNARLQRLTHFWSGALLLSSLIRATCSCLDLRPQSSVGGKKDLLLNRKVWKKRTFLFLLCMLFLFSWRALTLSLFPSPSLSLALYLIHMGNWLLVPHFHKASISYLLLRVRFTFMEICLCVFVVYFYSSAKCLQLALLCLCIPWGKEEKIEGEIVK